MGILGGCSRLITDCTKEMFADGTLKGFAESQGIALAKDYRDEMDIWEFVNGEWELKVDSSLSKIIDTLKECIEDFKLEAEKEYFND
jgi:hypothetical protein